ncbi:MAG: hypothetical protein WCP29_03990 [Acidobacteriota bacterium]
MGHSATIDVGCWWFIRIQSAILLGWAALNVTAAVNHSSLVRAGGPQAWRALDGTIAGRRL